jgi:hypothetical protein
MAIRVDRLAGLLAVATVMALAACGDQTSFGHKHGAPQFATEYQAVFMQNGQVFFGKLELTDTDYATLRDVFFIQQQVNPETKQASGVLLKRSNELHAPDLMHINARQIALVEPVTPSSRVAQLSKDAGGAAGGAPKQ